MGKPVELDLLFLLISKGFGAEKCWIGWARVLLILVPLPLWERTASRSEAGEGYWCCCLKACVSPLIRRAANAPRHLLPQGEKGMLREWR